MSKETMLDLDLGFCDVCDSWVTVVEINGDLLCKGEVEIYGADMATVCG
jgi:hypothetical protein